MRTGSSSLTVFMELTSMTRCSWWVNSCCRSSIIFAIFVIPATATRRITRYGTQPPSMGILTLHTTTSLSVPLSVPGRAPWDGDGEMGPPWWRCGLTWTQVLGVRDEILHGFHHLSHGQVLQDALAHADDFADLRRANRV